MENMDEMSRGPGTAVEITKSCWDEIVDERRGVGKHLGVSEGPVQP